MKRVTSAVKAVTTPMTPKKMSFSPVERRKVGIGMAGGSVSDEAGLLGKSKKNNKKNAKIDKTNKTEMEKEKEKSIRYTQRQPSSKSGLALDLGLGPGPKASVKNGRNNQRDQDRDLEKGIPEHHQHAAASTGNKDDPTNPTATGAPVKLRPKLPSVRIPNSAFEIDSPKTPVWKKVFGR
jgi:hypothetical protein